MVLVRLSPGEQAPYLRVGSCCAPSLAGAVDSSDVPCLPAPSLCCCGCSLLADRGANAGVAAGALQAARGWWMVKRGGSSTVLSTQCDKTGAV